MSNASQTGFLEYLIKRISSRKLNFFLGAGISKNPPSNLPVATDFRIHFFKELCNQEKISETYDKYVPELNKIPFESFAASIISDTDFFDCFIRIFGFGMPNKNHELIASLMLKGNVSNVLTTNFDALLERAVSALNKTANLRVLCSEKQFDAINLHSVKIPTICKIHGGIQEPVPVCSTLIGFLH